MTLFFCVVHPALWMCATASSASLCIAACPRLVFSLLLSLLQISQLGLVRALNHAQSLATWKWARDHLSRSSLVRFMDSAWCKPQAQKFSAFALPDEEVSRLCCGSWGLSVLRFLKLTHTLPPPTRTVQTSPDRPNHFSAPGPSRRHAPWDVPSPLGRRFRDPKAISWPPGAGSEIIHFRYLLVLLGGKGTSRVGWMGDLPSLGEKLRPPCPGFRHGVTPTPSGWRASAAGSAKVANSC